MAGPGADPLEVCVGVSPAFATRLWLTMSGLPVGEALRQIVAGIEEEGCVARLVRVRSTFDLGVIGLTAAQLAGSGIGVGLQAKGTAVINRRDLPPLACLELLSIAPLLTEELYRDLGSQRRPLRQGPAARARPQPVHGPGDRGALPRRGRSADRRGTRGVRARCAARRREDDRMTPAPEDEPVVPGRSVADPSTEITLEAAVNGDLSPADLRIHPETLRHQADVAEEHGNPQLGENLRRAAELTAVPDDEVLEVYEALRPGRSTLAELEATADRLEAADAPLCAALVREAAAVYERRGILRTS